MNFSVNLLGWIYLDRLFRADNDRGPGLKRVPDSQFISFLIFNGAAPVKISWISIAIVDPFHPALQLLFAKINRFPQLRNQPVIMADTEDGLWFGIRSKVIVRVSLDYFI